MTVSLNYNLSKLTCIVFHGYTRLNVKEKSRFKAVWTSTDRDIKINWHGVDGGILCLTFGTKALRTIH